jgi:hypothetical protein
MISHRFHECHGSIADRARGKLGFAKKLSPETAGVKSVPSHCLIGYLITLLFTLLLAIRLN